MQRTRLFLVGAVFAATGGAVAGSECPRLVGQWAYGSVSVVELAGPRMLFGSGRALMVVDVSDPAVPSLVGELNLPGKIVGLSVVQDRAYVAADEAGLRIVDLSDPATPREIGSYVMPSPARAVAAARGDYVFVLADVLTVLDVRDPGRPQWVAHAWSGWDIAVAGNYAFVTRGLSGIDVLNIYQPWAPVRVATHDTPGFARSVAVQGDFAWVAAEDGGVVVVNVSDPTRPQTVGIGAAWKARDVAVAGGLAFVADSRRLRVLDASDPSWPAELAWLGLPAEAQSLAARSGVVFVADADAGVRVVDVSSPASPTEISAFQPPLEMDSWGVAVDGEVAFVATRSGLGILDISDPFRPVELGRCPLPGFGRSVAVSGDLACVALEVFGSGPGLNTGVLAVVDVSDRTQPTALAVVELPSPAQDVVVSQGRAYVAAADAGLRVIDLTDPSAAAEVGFLAGLGWASGVAVTGDRAYVTDQWSGLRVVDVASPTDMWEVGAFPSTYPRCVALSGSLAFVGGGAGGGLRVLDVEDPEHITEVGLFKRDSRIAQITYSVALSGSHAYIAGSQTDLGVVDVSDPVHPIEDGWTHLGWSASDVTVSGSYAVVAKPGIGVLVYDVSSCGYAPPHAAFVWGPSVPKLGREVGFTDRSTGRREEVVWDFGDGWSSTDAEPRHRYTSTGWKTVSLTVSNQHGSDTATRSFPVEQSTLSAIPISSADRYSLLLVPAAAHTSGTAGTEWVTDLVLHSPRGDHLWSGAAVSLFFLESGQDNSEVSGRSFSLNTGESLKLGDVVAEVFDEGGDSGALLALLSSLPETLVMSSRTYNDADAGTYGQFIPGFDREHAVLGREPAGLIQLAETSSFRTNLGVVDLTGDGLEVEVALFDASGAAIGGRTLVVPPYGFTQENSIIASVSSSSVPDAYAVVTASDPDAAYFTYASIVDNVSGDPSFVAPAVRDAGAIVVPAAAHSDGANGTTWRTDLEVCNLGSTAVTYSIELLAAGVGDPPVTTGLELASTQCVRREDVVWTLFSFTGAGALRVTPATGELAVSSRTFNDLGTSTYGQLIPGRAQGDALVDGDEARLIQLAHSHDGWRGYRANIGCVNLGEQPMDLDIDLYRGDGIALGRARLWVQAGGFWQANDVFRRLTSSDVLDAFAVLSSVSSGARYLAYASVVDNRSGDPIYIPAVRIDDSR